MISPSDPCSAWTAKANKRVQFGYGLNYLIDIENAVIVDVEPTPARTYDEVEATKTMLDRTERCFGIISRPITDFERMRLRGLSGARDEFHLAAIVQNLKTWPSAFSGHLTSQALREERMLRVVFAAFSIVGVVCSAPAQGASDNNNNAIPVTVDNFARPKPTIILRSTRKRPWPSRSSGFVARRLLSTIRR